MEQREARNKKWKELKGRKEGEEEEGRRER